MRPGRGSRLSLLPLLGALALGGPWSPAAAQQGQGATRERLIPLEVTINGSQGGSWALLERDGTLYAPAEAFDEWRVNRRPDAAPLSLRGQLWYPLGSVPGFQAQLNLANQSVDLVFSPAAFAATRVAGSEESRPPLSPVEPALFLNFDTNLSYNKPRAAKATQEVGALAEVGWATNWGVLTSSYVGRNLNDPDPTQPRNVRRLETTFTRDFPDRNVTLRLGDSATRTGLWGRGIYFGGLHLTRNFSLTPGFVTQPIPLISGTSSAPSTVELYVNDALRQTSQVPTGPFVIDNFPLLTGAGQARLVVRDVLGRETVIVQPFFSHANLLEQGLADWSLELGAVRRNLGTDSANYGERFTSGMWRYGLNRTFTIETRAELARDTQSGGLGLTYALPWQMLGVAAVAASRDAARGSGTQWVAGVEHDSLQHGFSVRAEGASIGFRQVGLDDRTLPNRLELSASYNYNAQWGALGFAVARIESYDRGPLSTYSLNFSRRIGARSSLTASITHVQGSGGTNSGTALGVTLTVPMDNHLNMASSGTYKSEQRQLEAYASASKGLSAETGIGWRVLGGTRASSPYAEGGLYYQGDKMLLTGDVSASREQSAVRLGAQGGLVLMGGRVFASRRVDNSFALVEVPGHGNVGVGFQGSALTRTDADGFALLPRLVPYQVNSIRLDPTELPISAELDSIEQTAVPAMRSGVRVVFPVRSGRGALLRIVLDDGEPAPAGAEVRIVGDTKEFFVARRGESFVTGLKDTNTLTLQWKDATCRFEVKLPPGALDEIARVGPLTCPGVKR